MGEIFKKYWEIIHGPFMAEQTEKKSTKKTIDQTEPDQKDNKKNMTNPHIPKQDLTMRLLAEESHKRAYKDAPDSTTELRLEDDDDEDIIPNVQITEEERKEAEARHQPAS